MVTEFLIQVILSDSNESAFLKPSLTAKDMALLVLLLTDPAQQRVPALLWAHCGPQRKRCLGGLSKMFLRVTRSFQPKATGSGKAACLVRQLQRALHLVTYKVNNI